MSKSRVSEEVGEVMEKANYRAYADSKHARDIGGNPIKKSFLG